MREIKLSDILGEDLKEEIQKKEKFEIDSLDKANWAMSKIAEAETHVQKIKAECSKLISRIKEYERMQTEDSINYINKMTGDIEGFMTDQINKQTKKRSINLIAGTASLRKSSTVQIDDEKEAMEFLEKHQPLCVKKSIDKMRVKNVLKDGEVPGVSIVEKENFSIKIHNIASGRMLDT